MASLKQLTVKIAADTKGLDAGITSAAAKLSAFGDKAISLGGTLSTSVTAPIAAMGAGILYTAGQFEAAMNKLQGISGVTGDAFTGLREKAKELGATTSFSASEAAQGMIALSQAGLSADQVMAGIGGTLQLAAAGGLELGEASGIAATAMAQFGLDASEVDRVANVMAATASSAFTDIQQLSQALKFGGQSANSAGMSFEQTAAALAILAQKGDAGSTSGERLRTVLGVLAGPSKGAADALASLGIAVADVNVEARGLPAVLDTLKAANIGTADAIKIFGVEAKDAARSLIEAGGSGFDEFTAKLTGTDAAAVQAGANMKGFEGAMKALQSATEGLGIAIAEAGLIDWATSLVTSFTELVRNLSTTSPELFRLGTIAAGVIAAAGPLLMLIGSLSSGLAALAPVLTGAAGGLAALSGGPVTLAVAALIGISAAIVGLQDDSSEFVKEWKTAWDSIKTTAKTIGDAVKADVKAAWEAIVRFSGPIFDQIVRIADTAMGIVRELLQLPGVKQSVEVVWVGIRAIVEGTWEAIKGIISGALSVIEGVLKAALAVLTGDWQGFKDGLMLIVEGMWTAITGVFSGGVTAIKNTLIGLKDSVLSVFSDIGDELVGNSIVPDEIVDPTIGEFERMGAGAKQATHQLALDVDTEFSAVGTTLATNKTEFETWRNGIDDAVKNLDIGGKIFSGAFAPGKWKETLKGIATDFLDLFLKPIKDGINDFIAGGLKDLSGALSGIGSKLSGIFTGGGGGDVSMPGTGGFSGAASSVFNQVTGAITAGFSAVDTILSHFGRRRQEGTLNAIEENTRTHMLLFADFRESVGFFQNNELQEQTANLEYIVANGDEMKATLWSIRDILSGGISISGVSSSGVADMSDAVDAGMNSGMRGAGRTSRGSLLDMFDSLLGGAGFPSPSRSRTRTPQPGDTDSASIGAPMRSRIGQQPPSAEEIGESVRDALAARNPLAVVAAELGNPLAQLVTGSNFLPTAVSDQTAAIDAQTEAINTNDAEQTAAIQIASDTTNTRLSEIHATLHQMVTDLRAALNREIVLSIDGQEIARAVGAGQEALRATA